MLRLLKSLPESGRTRLSSRFKPSFLRLGFFRLTPETSRRTERFKRFMKTRRKLRARPSGRSNRWRYGIENDRPGRSYTTSFCYRAGTRLREFTYKWRRPIASPSRQSSFITHRLFRLLGKKLSFTRRWRTRLRFGSFHLHGAG